MGMHVVLSLTQVAACEVANVSDGAWGYWVDHMRNWREGVFCSRSGVGQRSIEGVSVCFFMHMYIQYVFMHK